MADLVPDVAVPWIRIVILVICGALAANGLYDLAKKAMAKL